MNKQKQIILDATHDLILHYGIKKTTVEDIADASGMAKASIYHYFKSKDEICAEVIFAESEKVQTKIKNVIASKKKPKEKLVVYFLSRLQHFWNLRNKYKYFFKEYYNTENGIRNIRENFYQFETKVIQDILSQLPGDSATLKTMLRKLMLGYEVEIVQGKTLDQLRDEIRNIIYYIININQKKEYENE